MKPDRFTDMIMTVIWCMLIGFAFIGAIYIIDVAFRTAGIIQQHHSVPVDVEPGLMDDLSDGHF